MSTGLPPDDRLAAIKAEGARRRTHRHRRNTAFAGVAAVAIVVAVGVGTLAGGSGGSSRAPVAAHESSTASACRDSTDASCGTFSWDPAPRTNRPLHARLELPSNATSAMAFHGTVEWSDSDASRVEPVSICWGDAHCPNSVAPCKAAAYGPWTPPPTRAGNGTLRFDHTYATPGRYAVTIVLTSHAWPAGNCFPDPYGSTRRVHGGITVAP